MISPEKWQKLRQRMADLDISEQDIDEHFTLSSGRGGQKLHKTESCVQLHHAPSDVRVKCSETRSREDNRFYARRRMCDKIEAIALGEQSKQQQEIAKLRKQKQKRSKRAKKKMMADKQHQSAIKSLRKRPKSDD